MHINFKEPHIKKSILYQNTNIKKKIQLVFQVTKFFILEAFVDIFILT